MNVSIPPPNAPSSAALAAVRAAMLAEAAKPRVTWRARTARVVLASLGLAAVIGVGALAVGQATTGTLNERWLTLAGLALVGPCLAWAAAAPGAKLARVGALLGATLVAGALVWARPAETAVPSSAPEWLCTVLHLAVAAPAAFFAVTLLRGMAPSTPRALAAGLGVGTTGALLGELLCERDAAHVAGYHLAAWLLAAFAVVVIARTVKTRSWAP